MKYFLVVGEASGDLHASRLMIALRAEDPDASFAFVGGPLMREIGGLEVHRSESLSFMGFSAVLKNLFYLSKVGHKVQQAMLDFHPDVVICVDFSGFCFRYILPFAHENLPLAKVVYYIPPKVWAWKRWRVSKLRQLTDLVLTIFPFEVSFFRNEGLTNVRYVGNPTLEAVDEYLQKGHFSDYGSGYIALLCGSRVGEVRENLPLMIRVLQETGRRGVLAVAPTISDHLLDEIIAPEDRRSLSVVRGDTYGVVRGADAALVTSGTATLETALLGTPQVVCYAVNGGVLANLAFDRLFSIPFISLVNLIVGEEVVRELFGGDFTDKKVLGALLPLFSETEERRKMLSGYAKVRGALSDPGSVPASVSAARAILALLRP